MGLWREVLGVKRERRKKKKALERVCNNGRRRIRASWRAWVGNGRRKKMKCWIEKEKWVSAFYLSIKSKPHQIPQN